jgi:hypothetical protein
LSAAVAPTSLQINIAPPTSARVPVLIDTTFHPDWRREDGGALYAATPFAMLTFVDRSVTLNFARRPLDQIALYLSGCTLVALCGFVAWTLRRYLNSNARVTRLARWTTVKRSVGV